MQILFLITRYSGYGGIEIVTTVLANYFFKKGFSVSIISLKQENEELLDQLNSEISLYRFPDKNNMFAVENANYLCDLIGKLQPDVIINQESYSHLYKLLIGLNSKIFPKIITVEHNSPDARYRMLENYLKTEKLEFNVKSIVKKLMKPYILGKAFYKERKYHQSLYKVSDEYILLSKHFLPIFMNVSGQKYHSKIKFIGNPVTIKPNKISIKKKEKIILYVGRLDYGQKRVDRLIRIWNVVNKNVSDWKLIIVGDGQHRMELENYVKINNITNVFFKGSQSNVEDYYAKAAILCMTSNIEGWGLVLTEAMTYGCVPVLFNSFASAKDIITDKVNGRLISPFKEEDFSSVLLDLILNNEKLEMMANQAIIDSEKFAIQKIGDKWLELFKGIKE